MYTDPIARIKTNQEFLTGFKITKGLKQGCFMYPTLFKIYLEQALKTWKRKRNKMGIPVDDDTTQYIIHPLADDQAVIAQDDLEYMSRKLIEGYGRSGLKIKITKTGYKCIGGWRQDLHLATEQIIKQHIHIPRNENVYKRDAW